MTDNLRKVGGGLESKHEDAENLESNRGESPAEAIDTRLNVPAGINLAAEDAEEGGVYGEKEKKARDGGMVQSKASAGDQKPTARVIQKPSVEVMIKETEDAIKVELQKTEEEIRILRNTRDASMYVLNDKVRRARFLYGLMEQLKRTAKLAAKLAEEFVTGLWKQFVNKSN